LGTENTNYFATIHQDCQFLNKDETEHSESAMELQQREKKKVEILLIVKKLIQKIDKLADSVLYIYKTNYLIRRAKK
jgi:hypothetical protein